MNGFNDNNNSSVQSAGDDPALTALLRTTYAAPTDASYWTGVEQHVMTQVYDTQVLRSAYAAPTDASYWTGLEQRVMSRVREQAPWWAILPEWRAAGMIAAAAALFLVAASTIREQQNEAIARERAAIEVEFSVFDNTVEPFNMAISSTSPGARHARSAAPERFIDLIRP
ncbi:MAG: hypothetical protein ABJB74_21425 [Gemmatimonas sp.]